MHVIVAGCGRVGSGLAETLDAEGHTVCVIDHDPRARALLSRRFRGSFLLGGAFARDLLERSGVSEADAFVAVTSSDSANAVAARTARDVYRVPKVVARVYDPRRADIYGELGIVSVAHVRWSINEVRSLLLHQELTPERTFGGGETVLLRTAVAPHLAGRPLRALDVPGEIQAVEVTRGGVSFVPGPAALVERGDLVSFVVAASALDRFRSLLSGGPA